MRYAQVVYDRSPAWLQNILLSGYGWKLGRIRYGGIFQSQLRALRQSQWYSHEQLQELQARQLRQLLEHAQRSVPWFRSLFAERDIAVSQVDPGNLGSLLPVLSKQDVKTHARELTTDDTAASRLHTLNTSGTSGTPLTVRASHRALQKNYAFFERFLEQAGVASQDRSATFAGRMLLSPGRDYPPYWRYNWPMRTMLYSSYHISDRTGEWYLRSLQRLDPVYIDAYPSAIYTLAQLLLDHGAKFRIRPKAIVTSSETLFDSQRELIEQAFGCQVFDQYGSAEMAACITQCEQGAYHINPEYGIVEIVREDGRPAAPGEVGELICTGFVNEAMPMIRYRIGDSAVLSEHSCSCGRSWPVVESLLGRAEDMILTTDGYRIGRLDPLFKGLVGIKEAQIVQLARDRIVVNIVRDDDYTPAAGTALTEALQARVGRGMKIERRFLDRIPRTASGKFRAVISKLENHVSSSSSRPHTLKPFDN